ITIRVDLGHVLGTIALLIDRPCDECHAAVGVLGPLAVRCVLVRVLAAERGLPVARVPIDRLARPTGGIVRTLGAVNGVIAHGARGSCLGAVFDPLGAAWILTGHGDLGPRSAAVAPALDGPPAGLGPRVGLRPSVDGDEVGSNRARRIVARCADGPA